ncbi:MAG: O-antigen ligase family protein [Patescibacteria group bacterium]
MSKKKPANNHNLVSTETESIIWWFLAIGLSLVVFLPLVVSSSFYFPYITGKAFIFRTLIPLLLGGGMGLMLLSSNYRWRGNYILYILWALVGWALVVALLSPDVTRSLFSNFERMEGWLTVALVASYACLLPFVFRSKEAWIWFLRLNLLVGFLVAFIGLKDNLGLILDGSFNRLESTLGNAAYLGAYAMSQVFIAGLLLVIDKYRQSFFTWIYILLIPLQIWIVYLTATRGAMLGLLAGGLLFLILFLWQQPERKYKQATILVLGLVLVIGSLFYNFRQAEIIQNQKGLSRLANISLEDKTTRSRLMLWSLALEGVKDRPLIGWGPDNFRLIFDRYYNARLYDQEQWFDRSHNVFMDWLTGAGVPGLLLYLALFASLLYAWWLDPKFAGLRGEAAVLTGWLGAYVVQNIFVFDNLSTYLMLALLIGWTGYRLTGNSDSEFGNLKVKKAETVGWLMVVWFVLWLVYVYWLVIQPAQVAYHLSHVRGYQQAAQANSQSDLWDKTKHHYQKLLSLNPLYGQAEMVEQLVIGLPSAANVILSSEEQITWLQQVDERLEFLLDKNSEDVRLLYFKYMWLVQTDRLVESVEVIEKANEISPDRILLLTELIFAYVGTDRLAEASVLAEKALDIAPDDKRALDAYAMVKISSGEIEENLEEKLKSFYGTVVPDDNRYLDAYIKAGRLDLAEDYRQQLAEKDPSNLDNLVHWAMLNYGLENYAKALDILENVRERFPNQQNYNIEEFIQGVNQRSIELEF